MAKEQKKGTKSSAKAADKWKMKKTYDVMAPAIFNKTIVGQVVAEDPKMLVGRTINTALGTILNSNQHHIKIKLKIVNVNGFQAETEIIEIEVARGYLSSQVGENATIIDYVVDVPVTKEHGLRVKVAIFSKDKIHRDQKKQLTKLCKETALNVAKKQDLGQILQEFIFGKVGSQIFNKGKKIVPLRRVEIRKVEVRHVK